MTYIDDEDIVFINIPICTHERLNIFPLSQHSLDIFSCRDNCSITVACIVVATVELVHDECCSITAYVLDLCEFRIDNHATCRIPWVRGKDNGSATGYLF